MGALQWRTMNWPRTLRIPAIAVSVEWLVLGSAAYWTVVGNRAFLASALEGRPADQLGTWPLAAALVAIVAGLHILFLTPLATRWSIRPLLALLTVITAATTYHMAAYGVVFDPPMLRNILHTDAPEALELLSPSWAAHMALYAGLPLIVLARVRVTRPPWRRAALARSALWMVALMVVVASGLSVFQPLASLMRNRPELRYQITPANVLWSAGRVLVADARGAARPRQAIGLDATRGPSWSGRSRPLVLVLVVGETARAANWGLNGYARQTTPRLATLPVVNFPDVVACGTSTEVSLPCMFAPVGRRDYDADRIRGQESLLHVLARAGATIDWRDNQSGCKGVCEGLPADTVAARAPDRCQGERCLDEGLIDDLDQRLARAAGTEVWVLHMLGNHGPSYFRRYPAAFARHTPACADDDLSRCGVDEIVNAYDNALLYTDHVLATAIERLSAHADAVDSALLYVSDHGESLGERGLFLHGAPYAIAPDVQTHVPMVAWASGGFEHAAGLKAGCLRPALQAAAGRTVRHDHLFHTVLGLLDVRTSLHEPDWDMVAGCRMPMSDPR